MMRTVFDIPDLKNKKILLRVDFDVPVSDKGEIQEKFRINKQKPMIDYLIDHGAKVVMVAHISDSNVSSFGDLIPQLHILLGQEVGFIKTIEDIGAYLAEYPGIGLLEKIRQFPGETENDKRLALSLSKGFDTYINNDFAVCHREHASVSAITEFLPSYAGLLVKEEVTALENVINAPKEGKIAIIGGAKASTKVPVVKNFLDKTDKILLGGVVANDFLKEMGKDIGDSVADDNTEELLAGIDLNSSQIVLPDDFNMFENKILDIGPRSIDKYVGYIKNAKMVVWNGPVGVFEDPKFAAGTIAIAKAIVNSGAHKVVGGGDTVTAVDELGLLDKFDFVSTGGGAMLAFLSGQDLPGLKVLGYNN